MIKSNPRAGFEKMLECAKRGYPPAQNEVGDCYYYGIGVSQDFSQALLWFEKAAQQDIRQAQYNVGFCYYHGKGTYKNQTTAVLWYKKAAEAGHAGAQNELGDCYYFGAGTEKDSEKAFFWYKKAADQGSDVGEFNMGFCYFRGVGMSGARRMTRVDMRNRMIPIITRVHNKALAKTPDMTRIINLKVMYDPNPNAFALGRHTICVTEGLFDLPDEMIEGILAHEMGHLAYHHTYIQLLIGGGNFIITFALLIIKAISALITFIGSLFVFSRDDSTQGCGCAFSIFGIICSALIWLWTKFCMLFLMWSSRKNEYVADKYAMEIGYGYELAAALDSIGTGMPQNSFMKALYSSHPETHDRIGKLQEMGVPYSRY